MTIKCEWNMANCLYFFNRTCRLSSKHHKKEKSAEDTNKTPNVEYDYVEDTGSTYQELGHVHTHHNYNNA